MNTRLLLLFTLITFSVTSTMAQDYHPMPTGPARWDIARCWYFYPGGWYDRYYVEMDGTDTTLNGKTYKKLWHTTHHAPGTEFDSTYTHFMGGMREADRKVYMFSEYLCLDTIERVIYDFNHTVIGDTIYTQVLTNGLTQYIPHVLTYVDSVEINGVYHRQLHVQDGFFNEIWTEGVGSNMGVVYASYYILTDNSYDLNCFYDGNTLAFQNPAPAYSFCTPPFPPSECTPTTSIDPDISPDEVIIYPNPASNQIHIETKLQFDRIEMYNAIGVRVLQRSFTNEVDVTHLAPGVYWMALESKGNKQSVVKKVVIQ